MSQYYAQVFRRFKPQLIELTGDLNSLKKSLNTTNLLICGESHGVRENADILYTLCKTLGIKQLAIERSETNFRKLLESALQGEPDFLIPQVLLSVQASVMSLETLKTVTVLVDEGIIETIRFVDVDHATNPNFDDLDGQEYMAAREVEIARNIANMDLAVPTLGLLGKFHTRRRAEKDDVFPSALHILSDQMTVISLDYSYLSGKQYNAGRVIQFDKKPDALKQFRITKNTEQDYTLEIPEAHMIRT